MAGLDSNTKLLLHCDGTDGSTTFTDSKLISPHTVTAVGSAQVDTAIKELGTGSAKFDGNSDYLTIPDSADWNFVGADFTLDFWIRLNSVTIEQAIMSQVVNTSNRLIIRTTGTSGIIRFYVFANSGATNITLNITGFTTNTWHHVAFVRNNNTLYGYKDGVSSSNVDVTDDVSPDLGAPFNIGYEVNANYKYFGGYMDEIRLSNIARWTNGDSFTPSTQPYGPLNIVSIIFDPTEGSVAESKADEAVDDASTADSKAVEAITDASTADSKAVEAISDASTADSKAVEGIDDASVADSKAVIADSIADQAIVDASTADSKAVVADNEASVADSKAVVAVDDASTADSKAVVAVDDASTADSKAVEADSIADEAIVDISTADSKAVVATTNASVADSKAVVAVDDASTADSKAVVAVADASTADSKAVVADSIADEASVNVESAVGTEPGVGDYKVTDMKFNSDDSMIIYYDDSAIT